MCECIHECFWMQSQSSADCGNGTENKVKIAIQTLFCLIINVLLSFLLPFLSLSLEFLVYQDRMNVAAYDMQSIKCARVCV